jgi:hypothetical protein
MSAFEAYIDFCALKKHFTDTYDYHKYHGKLRRKIETFEKRKDKWIFEKLAKRKDYHDLLLANLAYEPKLWITDITGKEDGERRYIEWKRKQQSLSYIFESELNNLPEDLFDKEDWHDDIIYNYLNDKLSLESLCILLELLNPKLKEYMNPVWEEIIWKVNKYTPFVDYEPAKYRSLAYRRFKHSALLYIKDDK